MLTVETIRKIRLARHRDGKPIRQIARDLNHSKNTVKKVLRSEATVFHYERNSQPRPKLGPFLESLEARFEEDQKLPKKRRRTAMVLFEELQSEGYSGAYDSVRRHIRKWRLERRALGTQVFIPLSFDPAEAFQFDWSHEKVELAGMPATVKAAHLRLCHSRLFLVIAYPRETQEMVFDAHIRAFEFFGGVCQRGIYDNMKAAVNKVLSGKERVFNSRFEQLCSHYLYEPVACTPAAGWEKGQVENQIGLVRKRFFTPRPKFADYDELNAWLMSKCISWAKTHNHPQIREKTVWEVYEQERPYLLSIPRRFDSYAERPARVSPSSLVTFDRNRYSVACTEVGQTVQLRVYAKRIVVVSKGRVVGDHSRQFGRGKTIFDPWHYLPALERKPGALRNGAPFKDWDLPDSLKEIRDALRRFADWDRQFVSILSAVPTYGLNAVSEACSQALRMKAVSKDVVLNILARNQDEDSVPCLELPTNLTLEKEPVADCQRYDSLLGEVGHVT